APTLLGATRQTAMHLKHGKGNVHQLGGLPWITDTSPHGPKDSRRFIIGLLPLYGVVIKVHTFGGVPEVLIDFLLAHTGATIPAGGCRDSPLRELLDARNSKFLGYLQPILEVFMNDTGQVDL